MCRVEVAVGVLARGGGPCTRMVAAGLARTFRFETCLGSEKDGVGCCPEMGSEEESRVMRRKRESEEIADPRRSG